MEIEVEGKFENEYGFLGVQGGFIQKTEPKPYPVNLNSHIYKKAPPKILNAPKPPKCPEPPKIKRKTTVKVL